MRDLDEAVYNAIGRPEIPFDYDTHQPGAKPGIPEVSTDWSWAMWAAEKAGLLSSEIDFEVSWDGEDHSWSARAYRSAEGPVVRIAFAEAPIGPEAICQAILRLKGVEI